MVWAATVCEVVYREELIIDEHPNKKFAFFLCSSPPYEADLVTAVGS